MDGLNQSYRTKHNQHLIHGDTVTNVYIDSFNHTETKINMTIFDIK